MDIMGSRTIVQSDVRAPAARFRTAALTATADAARLQRRLVLTIASKAAMGHAVSRAVFRYVHVCWQGVQPGATESLITQSPTRHSQTSTQLYQLY